MATTTKNAKKKNIYLGANLGNADSTCKEKYFASNLYWQAVRSRAEVGFTTGNGLALRR